ncbi:MAG TPA: M23 family metallopeptidase [Candidatus Gallacutalibacter stercoravium]|nr:M23 family metallopeptidase [Candidatus Gallacutalibacter stercoravium]
MPENWQDKVKWAARLGTRFLYVIGVRLARLLKQTRRKLKRLARHSAGWVRSKAGAACKAFGRSKVGSRLAAVKPAAKSETLKAEGAKGHKKQIVGALKVAAPVAAVALLVGTVYFWNNETFLQPDGDAVENKAAETMNQQLAAGSEEEQQEGSTPYQLAEVDSPRYADSSMLYNQLIQTSSGLFEEATGLYVDGELWGAVADGDALQDALQQKLDEGSNGEEGVSASFVQNVEQISGLYPKGSLLSMEAMNEKLNALAEEEAFYTVQAGDTLSGIAEATQMGMDELQALNGGEITTLFPGDQLLIQQAKPVLTVQVEKTESYESVIPYQTVTVEDESEYTEFQQVAQQGSNGLEQCVDKVLYIDGQEVSRESISRTVVQPAVEEIVTVGTKTRPSTMEGYLAQQGTGRSTGSLMWPVPYTRTVTSNYEMRWGKMHNGIDISSSNVYGQAIVAADGGTVVSVQRLSTGYGYHIQIDHGNGMQTLYAHCSEMFVSAGQAVSKGQVIGLVGSTGNSTGPHLHFEVFVNGARANPLDYVG